MTTLETATGKTRVEIQNFYTANINVLMSLGMNEQEARGMVQGAMKDTLIG